MKAEQAKLQNQLNEFVKKQADYEQVCAEYCIVCVCVCVCVRACVCVFIHVYIHV